jgi:ParB family chromosome partitioning protein
VSAARRPSGLGRGLDALLGDAPRQRTESERAETPRERLKLPIELLKPSASQPRQAFDEDAIEELAASIRSKGLLQPILVRPAGEGQFEIVAGERRWRAAQKARLHDVPVIVRELTDEEAAEIALVENVQRVDLNAVEEARAYQRLIEVHGRTQEEIARAVGKSRSHVANAARLLQLPEFSLGALTRGEISAGHARAVLSSPDPDLLTRAVLARGLSVRQTEDLARAASGAPARPKTGAADGAGSSRPKGKKDADTRALEADLSAALGLEVEIEHSPKGEGALTIRYSSLEQLDDLCRRLMGQAV